MTMRMPSSSMARMSNTWKPAARTRRFSPGSTLRMPICRSSGARRAGSCGLKPPSSTSSAGPSPNRQATGMPCRLPVGVSAAVLKSACASSHSTRSLRPCARTCRATAEMDPMARQWSPPSSTGSRPAPSCAATASCTTRFQATTSARCRKPPSGCCQGLSGPTRLPVSSTSMPWSRSARAMPATRSASGPMLAPRTLAPTSVGAPISATPAARSLLMLQPFRAGRRWPSPPAPWCCRR